MKLTDKELEALSKIHNKEKQQKIVDAVNALHGELTHDNCCFEDGDKYLHRTEKGNYCTVFSVLSDSSTLICTVEEFNQCVKEMSSNGKPDAFAEYAITVKLARQTGVDMQLQPEQIEWKNGDKCLWSGRECVFIGMSSACDGLATIEEVSGGFVEGIEIYRARLENLQKPPAKEKRWIVYDSNGNFCSEHDYKYEPYDKTCQVIEIEINV